MAQNAKLKDFLKKGVPLLVDTNFVKEGENDNGAYFMYGGKVDGKEFVHFASQSQHNKIQRYPAEKRGDGKTYHLGVRVILDSENKMQVYEPNDEPAPAAPPSAPSAPSPAAQTARVESASVAHSDVTLAVIGNTMKAIIESLTSHRAVLGENFAAVANTVFIEAAKRGAWVNAAPKAVTPTVVTPPPPPKTDEMPF
jgi:hypothetical protein